ncbi:hypothetical protein FKM82_026509 [Ascaphus truei]
MGYVGSSCALFLFVSLHISPLGKWKKSGGVKHLAPEKCDIVWNEKRALQPEVSGSGQMFWLCLIENSSNVMWCQENEVMP